MNSCCLLLKNYPQCSTSKSSGALTSLRTWPPKQTYTQSKSLESVLIQMHKKLKNLLVFKCWCSIISLPSYELYWLKDLHVDCVVNVMSLKRYEFIRHYLHTNDNMGKKDDSSRLFKIEPVNHALRTNCLSVKARAVPFNWKKNGSSQNKRKWNLPILTKEDSQVGIQKLCSDRCL